MSEEEVDPSKKTTILGLLAQGIPNHEVAEQVGVSRAYVSQVKTTNEKIPSEDTDSISKDVVDKVTGMTMKDAKIFAMNQASKVKRLQEELKNNKTIPIPLPPETGFTDKDRPFSTRIKKVIADTAEAKIYMSQFPGYLPQGYLPQDLEGKTIQINQQPPEGQVMPGLNLNMALNDMKKLALMRVYKEMATGGPGMAGQQLSGGQAQIAQLTLSNVTKDFELKLEQIKKKENATPQPPQGPTETQKQLISTMESIKKRLDKADADKAQKKLIQDVTKPYMDQIGTLEEKVEELGKPSTTAKSDLEVYFEQRRKLKEEGFLHEPKPGSVIFGSEGIPVSGSVPAWAVYGPDMLVRIVDNVEKRVGSLTNRFGLNTQPIKETPLPVKEVGIKLPPKPGEESMVIKQPSTTVEKIWDDTPPPQGKGSILKKVLPKKVEKKTGSESPTEAPPIYKATEEVKPVESSKEEGG